MARRSLCCICARELNKNELGLNKKLLDARKDRNLCLTCMAAHLDISEESLLEKIEDFKNSGCTLFE